MHEGIDPGQTLDVILVFQAPGDRGITRSGRSNKSDRAPSRELHAPAYARTKVPVCPGNRHAGHGYASRFVRSSLVMRCAFAIIVSVKVVAGTFGKTDASTRCMRSQPSTRPRRS